MYHKPGRLVVPFLALLAACSQVPVREGLPSSSTVIPTAATAVPPRGTTPARITWSRGGLTLKGCAWQGHDKNSKFRSLYLETARARGHLTLYDSANNRYLRLPKRGGQAHWRKGSSPTWWCCASNQSRPQHKADFTRWALSTRRS